MKPQSDRLTDYPSPAIGSGNPPAQRSAERAELVSHAQDRRARGLRALEEIAGLGGVAVVQSLRATAPELADWIIDFSYGDVMSRPGLDHRTRELTTIAALIALGNAQPQLKVHMQAALHVGCRPQEIIEVILQMTVFCGFPAALNALGTLKEVLPR